MEELIRESEKAANEVMPILIRLLCASWNFVMQMLIALKIMPVFRTKPWLLAAVIILLMALVPPFGIFLFIIGFVAMANGAKSENNFIIPLSETGDSSWDKNGEDERDALQGEAMLRVYEEGASMEEAAMVADAIGKLYDKRKA